MLPHPRKPRAALYREIASRILDLVIDGSIKPGERVPSLRVLAERMGVSMGTVKEAYWYLEGRRYLEARPSSGFFVRMRLPTELPVHGVNRNPLAMDPAEMSLCRIYGYFSGPGRAGSGHQPVDCDHRPGTLAGSDPVALFSRIHARPAGLRAELYHDAGLYELRQRISVLGPGADTRVSADGIVITNGCHEALVLALMAVCQSGDLVAVEAPAISICSACSRPQSSTCLKFTPTQSRYTYRNAQVRHGKSRHTSGGDRGNFANPSGSLMPDERKAELVALTAKRGIP